ncbi:hypothetical protein ACFE04_011367 [Oxalis oulophora]
MSAASRSYLHKSSISPFCKSSYQQPPRPLSTSLSSKRPTTPSSTLSRLSKISTPTSPVVLLCLLTDRRPSRDLPYHELLITYIRLETAMTSEMHINLTAAKATILSLSQTPQPYKACQFILEVKWFGGYLILFSHNFL